MQPCVPEKTRPLILIAEQIMMRRYLVAGAAWLEIVTGAALVVVPDAVCRLLFGAGLEGAGDPLARVAGIGLIALGIACLPSTEEPLRSAVLGLFAYNLGTAILCVWVVLTTTLRGALLWPAAVLHAAIAAALLVQLLNQADAAALGSHRTRS